MPLYSSVIISISITGSAKPACTRPSPRSCMSTKSFTCARPSPAAPAGHARARAPQHRAGEVHADDLAARKPARERSEGRTRAAAEIDDAVRLDADRIQMVDEARADLAVQHRVRVITGRGALVG